VTVIVVPFTPLLAQITAPTCFAVLESKLTFFNATDVASRSMKTPPYLLAVFLKNCVPCARIIDLFDKEMAPPESATLSENVTFSLKTIVAPDPFKVDESMPKQVLLSKIVDLISMRASFKVRTESWAVRFVNVLFMMSE